MASQQKCDERPRESVVKFVRAGVKFEARICQWLSGTARERIACTDPVTEPGVVGDGDAFCEEEVTVHARCPGHRMDDLVKRRRLSCIGCVGARTASNALSAGGITKISVIEPLILQALIGIDA